jgi:hypothetical protein
MSLHTRSPQNAPAPEIQADGHVWDAGAHDRAYGGGSADLPSALPIPAAVQLRIARAAEIARFAKLYIDAERAVAKTSAARFALPAGSSRARVTTANARWSTACEHRDRLLATLADLGAELGR